MHLQSGPPRASQLQLQQVMITAVFLLLMRMCCLLSTAVRDSWLINAKHPSYAATPCSNPQCLKQGCMGNRLERNPTADGMSYKIVVEHSKTEESLRGATTVMTLPKSWTQAVSPWVEHGHTAIAEGCE